MARFWIGYSTGELIEAKTEEEARELFWSGDYEYLGCADIKIDYVEKEDEND